jgi:hypothetical protein
MRKKIFFLFFLMFAATSFWGCKDDNDAAPCSAAWASEVVDEVNAMSAAAQAYALNPTSATCNAYKQAAQAYVDALEPYGNCSALTGQSRTDWQNTVNNAQQEINNLNCSK